MAIQYATSKDYKYIQNGSYSIYSTPITEIIRLPNPSSIISPITIKNSNSTPISIYDASTGILVTVLTPESTTILYVDTTVPSWVVIGGGGVAKEYVDEQVATRLAINGSNGMTGILNMANSDIDNVANPVDPQDAATKNYVDQLAEELSTTKLSINGSNGMQGNLQMNTNKIINLSEPVDVSDATTKSYVDTSITAALALQSDNTLNLDNTKPPFTKQKELNTQLINEINTINLQLDTLTVDLWEAITTIPQPALPTVETFVPLSAFTASEVVQQGTRVSRDLETIKILEAVRVQVTAIVRLIHTLGSAQTATYRVYSNTTPTTTGGTLLETFTVTIPTGNATIEQSFFMNYSPVDDPIYLYFTRQGSSAATITNNSVFLKVATVNGGAPSTITSNIVLNQSSVDGSNVTQALDSLGSQVLIAFITAQNAQGSSAQNAAILSALTRAHDSSTEIGVTGLLEFTGEVNCKQNVIFFHGTGTTTIRGNATITVPEEYIPARGKTYSIIGIPNVASGSPVRPVSFRWDGSKFVQPNVDATNTTSALYDFSGTWMGEYAL